ncbi:hypothetical protein FisN_12Lu395 [Fistulifera solaris]|jgi:hypothetical protein|uniref:Uncharacterized protein n=1 Tax=Fistulifera solaris TaxID=1519565 RepID=A0A1Z5JLZ8_FISSO|nr:hypothetical protein FisN_12Lu395 [Fistulifera solaris]|eukprot:GAX14999.1 hypothetical protein FisN_12Lu395 [Fistulifera solaris]
MSTTPGVEEKKEKFVPSNRRIATITNDFPGTASYLESNWDLLLDDGQQTLIHDNTEELIGWALHMDAPYALKKGPSTPNNNVAELSVENSKQSDQGEGTQDNVSASSSLEGKLDDDLENDLSSKMKADQVTKKRKRPKKVKIPLKKLSFTDFSSSSSPPNMLRALPNIPPRPSVLRYLHDCFVKIIEKDYASNGEEKEPQKDACWESLDTSALVALGVIVEEMLTASLVPLAEMHVHRCRHIEDQQVSSEEWTLPPTEAIMKLMASYTPSYVNPLGSLPTTRTPLRVSKEIANPNSFQQVMPTWQRTHNTDVEDLYKLWHVYKYFLPSHWQPTDVNLKYKSKKPAPVQADKPIEIRAQTPESSVTRIDAKDAMSKDEELPDNDPDAVTYTEV